MTRPIALVTGASSGIGEAFARRLARDGQDLVLVARREDRLKELADELHSARGVDSEVLVADLTDPDDLARVAARAAETGERAIELLVNNAGSGSSGPFVDLPVAGELAQVQLNIAALVRLTHAALPGMLDRNRGGIINVGSVGAFQAAPHNATYSATKAFVLSFTEAIHEEARGTGVRITCLCPGFTATEFGDVANVSSTNLPSFLQQGPDAVVATALRDLRRNRAVSVPGVHNVAAALLSQMLPRAATRRVAGIVMRRLAH
jgi:hypothetical protein